MSEELYKQWQQYFRKHPAARWCADFFASRVAALTLVVPCIAVWYPAGRLYIAWAGVGLIIGRLGVAPIIAYLFPQQRPYQRFKFVPVAGGGLFSHTDDDPDSFPSGHATALGILAFALMPFSSAWTGIAVLCALAAGIARVLLGWHYVRDVFAGLLLAGAVVGGVMILGMYAVLGRFIV